MDISPEQLALFQDLHDKERSAHAAYQKASAAFREKKIRLRGIVAQARKASLEARKAKIQAYTALGLKKQNFYQLINVSRGLCRICGKPGENGLCDKHRRGRWKNHTPKKK
jgi:hypothetical protein